MRLFAAGVVGILALTATFQVMRLLGTGGWLTDQISGFSQRVLGGVTIGTDRDLSWKYRSDEINNLWPAIRTAPLIGNGFGFPYQSPEGPTGSWLRVYAPYYSHNFYLWLLAKTGVVGLAGFIWFALLPIIRGVRAPSVGAKISAIVAVSLLAIAFVWPVPETEPDSIVLGIALGSAMALSRWRAPSVVQTEQRGYLGARCGKPLRARDSAPAQLGTADRLSRHGNSIVR